MGRRIDSGISDKRKRIAFSIALFLIFCCFVLMSLRKLGVSFDRDNGLVMLYCGVCIAVAAVFSIIANYLIEKKTKLEKYYFVMVIVLGVFFSLAIPPLSAPDEAAHYYSAYYLSNQILCHSKQAACSGILMRAEDYSAISECFKTELSREHYQAFIENFSLFSIRDGYKVLDATPITREPFGYIFSAMGIMIGRIFHLGAIPVIYLGRIMNLLAYVIITHYALKKIPTAKMAIFAISILPMTLQQIGSYSYDGMSLAYSILFVSYAVYLISSNRKLIIPDYLILIVSGALMSVTKIIYFPLLILILFIPNGNYSKDNKKAVIEKIAIIVFIMIIFALIQASSINAEMTNDNTTIYDGIEGYTTSWIFGNIGETVRIFLNTLVKKGAFYLQSLVGGCLGPLQITLPFICILGLGAMLLFSFINREKESFELRAAEKVLIVIVCVGIVSLSMFSMMLAWTPFGSDVIEGVQGRYFLQLLLPIAILFKTKNRKLVISDNIDEYYRILFPALDICCLMYLVGAILFMP